MLHGLFFQVICWIIDVIVHWWTYFFAGKFVYKAYNTNGANLLDQFGPIDVGSLVVIKEYIFVQVSECWWMKFLWKCLVSIAVETCWKYLAHHSVIKYCQTFFESWQIVPNYTVLFCILFRTITAQLVDFCFCYLMHSAAVMYKDKDECKNRHVSTCASS